MNKCYKCKERELLLEKKILGCHSFCEYYKKFNAEREEIRKKKSKSVEEYAITIDRFNRIAKKKPDKINGYRRYSR